MPVSDKPTILDNIIDEMLDTLNYKDYNKREIEGAKRSKVRILKPDA